MAKKSSIVKVRYVGPHDEIQIAVTGATCCRGETVEVADWVAGSAPSGTDPGVGLLAQVDNWQSAAPTKTDPSADAPSDNPEE